MSSAFYLTPMPQARQDGELYRYCAVHDENAAIVAAGGSWEYSEIDGDQAIARVRAPDAVLASLALAHRQLSDAEARAAWTPDRARPFLHTNGTIKFRAAQRSPTTPLDLLVSRVDGAIRSTELKSIVALWLGAGFGLGWRVPYFLALALALNVGEPTSFSRLALRAAFDQTGAFPTTNVLDAFNRTENPLSDGGNWTTGIISSHAAMEANGTQCKGTTASNNSGYRNNATYGPDTETFYTLPTLSGTSQVGVYARLANPGSAGATDGYRVLMTKLGGADEHRIARVDNDVGTQLAAPTQEVASGDSMGLRDAGSVHEAYYKAGAGNWTLLGSATDGTYTVAGNIGLQCNNTAHRVDDFGGGTIVGGILFRRDPMRGLIGR
jgi:hypothetical protein